MRTTTATRFKVRMATPREIEEPVDDDNAPDRLSKFYCEEDPIPKP